MRMRSYFNISGFLKILTISVLLFACGAEKKNETLAYVFTMIPAHDVRATVIQNGNHRYLPGMQVAMIEVGKSADAIKIITNEFHSARAPEASFNGKNIIFSGQKNQGDIWQIWTYNMKKKAFSQITNSETNCTDPTWLPDGKIAYSKLISEKDGLQHHALFRIGPDGCCEERITYQPHEDLNAMVLKDGRLLFSSIQIKPTKGSLKYLAMRPDGTKAELFLLPGSNAHATGKAVETRDRKVLYTEDGKLVSVSFNRPLHTRKVHENQGIYQSVFADNGKLLVSVTYEKNGIFELQLLSDVGEPVYRLTDSGNHIIEVSTIAERPVPRKLPTRVDPKKRSGFIVCLNTDASDIMPAVEGAKTAKVQVFSPEGLIGEVAVEEDGSFNLELQADTPLMFKTYDAEGNLLRGPSSWVWVRPAEHRGCVGCHEDREIAPENNVPKSLKGGPVSLVKNDISKEESHE